MPTTDDWLDVWEMEQDRIGRLLVQLADITRQLNEAYAHAQLNEALEIEQDKLRREGKA